MLPVKLEIDDFMSYERATVDFDFGSALISGANGSGKSSIFNAIDFALWGETRHKTADNVVRRGRPSCRVAFFFTHDGRQYRVIRTRSVKQSKMEVEFDEILSDGGVISMSHDTNKATDAEIRKVLRSNHDVFINSSYFRQNSFFDFVQGTFASRQAIISSLLNLDKWNRYQKIAKTTFDGINDKAARLKADVDRLGDLPAKLKQVSEQIGATKAEIERLHSEEAGCAEQIKTLEQKLNENKDEAAEYARYKALQERAAAQKQAIQNSELIINERLTLTEKFRAEIEANQTNLERLLAEIEQITEQLTNRPTADVLRMEEALIDGRSQFRVLTQQIENLETSDSCQMCGHEWSDSNAKQTFLEQLKERRAPIEEKLKRAEPKLVAIKKEIETAKQNELLLEKRRLQKTAAEKNIEVAGAKQRTADREIEQAQNQLKAMTAQLAELQGLIETVQNVDQGFGFVETTAALDLAKNRLLHLRKQISGANYELGAKTQEEKTLNEKLTETRGLEAQIAALNKQAATYSQLARAFSKDGIQAIIIDNIVEELTTQSNYWLHQFSNEPIYISFITQKKNTKGDWRETFDIEIQTPTGLCQFEDFSGGEQFRIGFAIRLAFSTIQAKRIGGEVQLLMLDEVSTSLDAAGLEAFVAIIRRLEKDMKVMVITHDDKLKEEFETIISVRRTIDGSIIE